MISSKLIGELGEDAAADYLVGEGFEIVARNWRSGHYELDLVAQRDNITHFIEVKCRKARGLTTSEFAINATKYRSMMSAVQLFMGFFNIIGDVQIGLIAVDHDNGKIVDLRYIPDIRDVNW